MHINMNITASYIYNKYINNIFDKQKWWEKKRERELSANV